MRNRIGSRDQFQVPLMFAFRDAFAEGDAAKQIEERVDGERIIAGRGSLRRRGADETLLRRNLAIDLLALVETIDFGSAVDLAGLDYVSKSVLNFGLPDLARVTTLDGGIDAVGRDLKAALLEHEPRLRSESLRVERSDDPDDVEHRVRLNVFADMACVPLDVPMEFAADIDIGSGKITLTRLPVST